MLVPRKAIETIRRALKGFPVVAVTGPRQSGKTTLVKNMFQERPYVSLEDPDELDFSIEDPRLFLNRFPDGAIIDEAQLNPELFSYLQTKVDNDGRMGLFILTGFQQFGFMEKITQSLAGRVATVPLLPFSLGELQGVNRAPARLEELLWTGLYPPIWDRNIDPPLWHGNYVETYLERDVHRLINVRDRSTFHRFLRMCAARTGQILNLSALGNDCGITHNTAKAWLSVLEASYVVHLLPPHHRNFRKRLIKAPKLFFLDTGLAAYLMGIQDAEQLQVHPQRGALFETWVLAELLKGRLHRGLNSNLFFWRDQSGLEVDIIIDNGLTLIPVEVKSGTTVNRDFFRGLERWTALAGEISESPHLVYGGDQRQKRKQGEVLPWDRITDLVEMGS